MRPLSLLGKERDLMDLQKLFKDTYPHWWLRAYEFQDVDQDIEPFLDKSIQPYHRKNLSWLRLARQALYLSTGSVAEKLGISRQSYSRFEQSEYLGTISLGKLAELAGGLNCELVYAIRPKKREKFSQVIWQALFTALIQRKGKKLSPHKRLEAILGAEARELMGTSQFRRQQGWTERR